MNDTTIAVGVAVAVLALLLVAAVRIVPEYERGVIFRLGRVIDAKGPGLFFIIPIVDRLVRVSLRTITMDVPPKTSSPATTSASGSTRSPTSTWSTRCAR